MKKFTVSLLLCAATNVLWAQQPKFNDTAFLQPIEVTSIRAAEKAPFAKTTVTKSDIEKSNLGQDLPFLLNQLTSVVVNSDAGNGVGYTDIRIRGTDATRINFTINGIPYNDAESQGTFLVNLPDIASSASSIQVQRGVGTSSNGAGAFGGTINLATNQINDSFFAAINNSYGSFNTWKNTFQFGSGIIAKHFTIDGRLSKITSDGYVDRASSNLQSYFVSAAYLDQKNSLRLNIFSGKEKTYQSWYGVDKATLESNRTYNAAGQEQPRTPYENETDNYKQTHYQLFFNHQFNSFWKANIAAFLTKGEGYYEEYRAGEDLLKYGLPTYFNGSAMIDQTDLIRQLWLDNNFYGTIFSVQHQKNHTQFTMGGGLNQYDGNHFGKVIWAQVQPAIPLNYEWYRLTATKKDFSLYTKWTEQWNAHWQSFADIQFRSVNYRINGFRNNPDIRISKQYSFLNPKFGVTYTNKNWQAFLSYALVSKEPNRDDFEAGSSTQLPKPERLQDVELGLEHKTAKTVLNANFYYMKYSNQLVLTGKINDVGAYTRSNIPKSYRLGIELQAKVVVNNWLNAAANIAFSKNKISNFTEFVDDYDNGGQKQFTYNKSDISFSPAVVGGYTVTFIPIRKAEISLLGKYVSRQYLDNTSQKSRSIDGYYVQDVRLSYLIQQHFFKATNIILQLNNVLNKKYESKGYTYSYVSGGLTTENYYFPMAPFNFMLGVNIRL